MFASLTGSRSSFLLALLFSLGGVWTNEARAEDGAKPPEVQRKTHCFLPTQISVGRDFYVFGPTGYKRMGAEDTMQIAFFRFRINQADKVYLSVFDPDASGGHDAFFFQRSSPTVFTVYGGPGAHSLEAYAGIEASKEQKGKVLASKKFLKEYDNQWYHFGPFKVTDGEIIGEWSYFKVVAQALSGGYENNFRLAAWPGEAAQGFCYKMSLTMQHKAGLTTEFFVEVPRGMPRIFEMSYDIDASGGQAYLDTIRRTFKLTRSSSGKWVRNQIDLDPDETGARCIYRFVKGTQKRTNMSFTFTDADGRPLRLFSSQGAVDIEPRPIVAVSHQEPEPEEEVPEITDPCLAYVFDASKSFDPDDENLNYEWDFGDETPKSQRIKVTHVYAKPGKYTVSLSVNDGSQGNCAIAKTSQEVVANLRPEAVAEAPEALITGDEGAFDGSKSSDTPGDVLTHHWEFGDGKEADGEVVQHAYQKGGTYNVTLTVKDDKNGRCSTASTTRIVRVNTPPVADAGEDIFLSKTDPVDPFEVTLDGSKSHDPDGDQLSYFWEFGDGDKGEGVTVKHVYPKGGTYPVKLTVKDDSGLPGDTDTDEAKVVLNRAPTAIAGGPRIGCMNEEVRFDGTRSVDLDGDGLAYIWDFGDGEKGEGPSPKHAYTKPGEYTVTLTVDDGRDTNISRHTVSQSVRIIESPVAIIKPVEPNMVEHPILFEADHEKNPQDRKLTYLWDFADGEKGEGTNVQHTFKKGGEYEVKLTVTDDSGLDCGASTARLTLRINTPPVPSLGIKDKICCIDQEVQFDASASADADGDGLSYLWDFGDENTSTEVTPVHIYRKGGVYKITLTVTDTSGLPGASASVTSIARVNRPPKAAFTVEGL